MLFPRRCEEDRALPFESIAKTARFARVDLSSVELGLNRLVVAYR